MLSPLRSILALTTTLGFLCTLQPARGSEIMYISDSANNLLRVDISTGEVEEVAGTFAQMTDIAFSPTGGLYAVTPSYLYEIDLDSGWSTLVGAHGFGDPQAAHGIDSLTFDAAGNLYAAGNDIVISIDPLTGAGTMLGTLSGHSSSGDLAVTDSDRLLLTTDSGNLVEVYRDGSGAELIGPLPHRDLYAMAGALDGHIYGVRSTDEIVQIDQVTGRATVIANLQRDFLYGRAWGGSFPNQFVPEPATFVLLLGGSVALLRPRRKPKN